ncbi:MAG: glycoside hydrolase family 44 protein [Planctomycetota bacterium]|jgi:hypothetical protein|nr:glycoside hydrolase family 44 protein [Planctomycetota bacterium]
MRRLPFVFLLLVPALLPLTAAVGPTLTVDANAGDAPISDDIYGMNFNSPAMGTELGASVTRWGGNSTTRYNYLTDVSSKGADWYFLSYVDENMLNYRTSTSSNLPHDSTCNQFIDEHRAYGCSPIVTMPMIGWMPKSTEIAWSYSVAKYGEQQQVHPYGLNDAGNGIRPDGSHVNNDPNDSQMPIDDTWVSNWVTHLVSRYGPAANGGIKLYSLDNEPMLWHETHRDVHPDGLGYDGLWQRSRACAAAIKGVDAGAQTLGPALYGWQAFFWSQKDIEGGGEWWRNPLDRLAHDNIPLAEWYLKQFQDHEATTGVRLLDYLDVHFYLDWSISLAPAGTPAQQATRLRSTRTLWDETYIASDETWIRDPIAVIPRMRDWVARRYPGTKLAITEYNFGGLEHINGALVQAEVLGIFGRERLDLATLYGLPDLDQPGAFAFRMYRNIDGAGERFGDRLRTATSANQDTVAIFAAQRSQDAALTLVVINKTNQEQTCALTLNDCAPTGPSRHYRYAASDVTAIAHLADLNLNQGANSLTLAPSSITTIIVPCAQGEPGAATRHISIDTIPGAEAWTIDPPDATGVAGSDAIHFNGLTATRSYRLQPTPGGDG